MPPTAEELLGFILGLVSSRTSRHTREHTSRGGESLGAAREGRRRRIRRFLDPAPLGLRPRRPWHPRLLPRTGGGARWGGVGKAAIPAGAGASRTEAAAIHRATRTVAYLRNADIRAGLGDSITFHGDRGTGFRNSAQVTVDLRYGDGAFAHGGCHPLYRPVPHVSSRKDARHASFQQHRRTLQLPHFG